MKCPTCQFDRSSELRLLIESLEGEMPKEKVCKGCGNKWGEERRDYDGYCNCHLVDEKCPDAYGYNGQWDDIGFNDCLSQIHTILEAKKQSL